jgi:hypothetical protein
LDQHPVSCHHQPRLPIVYPPFAPGLRERVQAAHRRGPTQLEEKDKVPSNV